LTHALLTDERRLPHYPEPVGEHFGLEGSGSNGDIYIADTKNFTVRKIAKDNTVTTLAGQAGLIGYQDGPGSPARFGGVGRSVSLIQIACPGAPATMYSTDQFLSGASVLALDANPNIVLPDHAPNLIRQISPSGVVSTLLGSPDMPGTTSGDPSVALIDINFDLAIANRGKVRSQPARDRCLAQSVTVPGLTSRTARPTAPVMRMAAT